MVASVGAEKVIADMHDGKRAAMVAVVRRPRREVQIRDSEVTYTMQKRRGFLRGVLV
jgi:hypothetical protein